MHCKLSNLLAALTLSALLCLPGCPVHLERLPEEKGGRVYGHVEPFRGRYWNYYERALSFGDGGFWKKAELDLRDAIRLRDADQRDARTYGRHFADYFPHRELGVVLYRQGRTEEAIRKLETSLRMAVSAKAQSHLDRARKDRIRRKGPDQPPPEINIRPPDPLTNAFSVTMEGVAQDTENFVRHITVAGKRQRVDVSAREVPFRMKVPLKSGENRIPVRATNLAGKIAERIVTVISDRVGPLVSMDERPDPISETNIRVRGYASDASGLAEFVINDRRFPIQGSPTALNIDERIPIQPGEKDVVVSVRDKAGNITSANIMLSDEGLTHKHPTKGFSRFAVPHLGGVTPPKGGTTNWAENLVGPKKVLSDMPAKKSNPILASARRDISFVEIILNNSETERVTYNDRIVIDGQIRSDESGTRLLINGEEEIAGVPRENYHFSHIAELNQGENVITVAAVAPSQHSDAVTLRIERRLPSAEKPESRLKLALKDFSVMKTEGMALSKGFEARLAADMREHDPRRFRRVGHLKLNPGESADDETTLKKARQKGFHCLLLGRIEERMNYMEKRSVIISAWIADVEGSEILVRTTDVYGEDADQTNIHDALKSLAEELKLKLIDELPLVKGRIEDKPSKNQITVNLGQEDKVKKGMRLVIYESADAEERELGEAKIGSVEKENSVAYLREGSEKEAIRPNHHVITR